MLYRFLRALNTRKLTPTLAWVCLLTPSFSQGAYQNIYAGSPDDSSLIVIEAEHFNHSRNSFDDKGWAESTKSGASGSAMQAPVAETSYPEGYATQSAMLSFQAYLSAKKYYVWARVYAKNGGSDTLHVGLNNEPVESGQRLIAKTRGEWVWTKSQFRSNNMIHLDVPNSGVQTINLWMRESNILVDRILLTGDSSYVPTGYGPAESAAYEYQAPTNAPPRIQASLPRNAIAGTEIEFQVTARDTGGSPRLSLQNASDLPGSSFTDLGDGSATFYWPIPANLRGLHSVEVLATDAVDSNVQSTQSFNIDIKGPNEAFDYYLDLAENTPSIFVQNPESVPAVVINAENFTSRKFSRDGYTWIFHRFNSPTRSYVIAPQTATAEFPNGYLSDSAALNYEIEFSDPGVYYLWLDMYAGSGRQDSVFVGLNGEASETAGRMRTPIYEEYNWTNRRMGSHHPAKIEIESAGRHTLNIYMREAAAVLRQVLLTRDADYIPTQPMEQTESFLLDSGEIPAQPPHVPEISADSEISTHAGQLTRISFNVAVDEDQLTDVTVESEAGQIVFNTFDPISGQGFIELLAPSQHSQTFKVRIEAQNQRYPTVKSHAEILVATKSGEGLQVPVNGAYHYPEQAGRFLQFRAQDFQDRRSSHDGFNWTLKQTAERSWMEAPSKPASTDYPYSYEWDSAELSYQIDFPIADDYYVWALVYAENGGSDTAHLGLNYTPLESLSKLRSKTKREWKWVNNRLGTHTPLSFRIDDTGVSKLHLWMRETGLKVERFLITRDPDFVPGQKEPASYDSDGDLLSDEQEVNLGTHPYVQDSDGDFMPDGWEVAQDLNALDPADAFADADLDGVSNYQEFLAKTDPNDSNSVPAMVSSVTYSFEDSQMPTAWSVTGTPLFNNDLAQDGTISLAFEDDATIEWSGLFAPAAFSFYVRSDCAQAWDKEVLVRLDGQALYRQSIEPGQWQKVELALSGGFHNLEIEVDSWGYMTNCPLLLDSVALSPLVSLFEMGISGVAQENDTLRFFNLKGETIRTAAIPGKVSYSDYARDISVLENGNIAVFNGTFSPVLSYYNPELNQWKHLQAAGWSTINVTTYGGIDSLGERVFVTNMSTSGQSSKGFVVFNTENDSSEFVPAEDLTDLTVGLDGHLYGLRTTTVYQYDVTTYEVTGQVNIQSAGTIAVDAVGRIYAAGPDGLVRQYDASGLLLKSLDLNTQLADIAIRADGSLLMTSTQGTVFSSHSDLVDYRPIATQGTFIDFVPDIDSDKDGLPDWWEGAMGLNLNDGSDSLLDLDQDGLNAQEEYELGTAENQPDSDQDGLTDGVEHLQLGTDPLQSDTDGDSLKDGDEVSLGTSPFDRDTDQDGLFDAEEINLFLTSPLSADTDGDGMSDAYEIEFALNALEDDASLDSDGDGLSNLEEHNTHTDPNRADTDGDSLTDHDEVHVYLTSPLQADTDLDRMRDDWEIAHGFDPTDASDASLDRDGDLFTNREEYFARTDPTLATRYPQPIEWQTAQGNEAHSGYTPHILNVSDFSYAWGVTWGSMNRINPVTASESQVFVSSDIYFGTQILKALNAETGQMQWELSYPDTHSINSPAFAQGQVYFQTGGHEDSFIRSVDAETGELQFESRYGNQWSRYLAPTPFDGDVYMAGGYYGGVYAFDGNTGDQNWFAGGPQYDEFTPAVDENHVYAFTTKLHILDRQTGELSRTIEFPDFDWRGYAVNVATVLTPEKYVVVSQQGSLVVFDTVGGNILWQRLNAGFDGQPTIANGIVYAVSSGSLHAIDYATGEDIWVQSDRVYQSNIIATKTHILVGDADSTVALDIATGEEVWRFSASGHLSLSSSGMLYIAGSRLSAVSLK